MSIACPTDHPFAGRPALHKKGVHVQEQVLQRAAPCTRVQRLSLSAAEAGTETS